MKQGHPTEVREKKKINLVLLLFLIEWHDVGTGT